MTNEITARVESEAQIIDGRLVISLSVSNLANAARLSDYFFQSAEEGTELQIDSEHYFAESVSKALNDEAEDGSTPITRMLDQAFEWVVENGADGVKEVDE